LAFSFGNPSFTLQVQHSSGSKRPVELALITEPLPQFTFQAPMGTRFCGARGSLSGVLAGVEQSSGALAAGQGSSST
jgi:hypothetical protein